MLMRNRMTDVNVYRGVVTSTGYVGKAKVWSLHGVVRADVQPTESRLAIAEYGERVSGMKTLFLPKGEDIAIGDGVFALNSAGRPEYTVISLLEYNRHMVAIAEKAVV